MNRELFNILSFAVIALPLAAVVVHWPRVVASKRVAALASCYAAFVLDEFLLMRVGRDFYFYHVLLSSALAAAVAAIIAVMESSGDRRRPPWPAFAALVGLVLAAASFLAYRFPDRVGTVAAVCLLLVLLLVLILLIKAIDDKAVVYIGIAAWWAFRNIIVYQPWPWIDMLVTGSLFVMVAGVVVARSKQAADRLAEEKDFLVRERDLVVGMLSDISSSAQSLVSVEFTVLRVLEAIVDGLAVDGAAVYRLDDKPGADARLRFAHSSGVFWTMQLHGVHGGGKTTFLTTDLRREAYALGEGIVGTVAQTMQPLELERGNDRNRMRALGLNPHNIRNLLAVPLRVKNQVLGVLVVQNRKGKPTFSQHDIRLLKALADLCDQKRTILYAEYLAEELLLELPHRQFVFTVPGDVTSFLSPGESLRHSPQLGFTGRSAG